jgi:hypothetical protein
VTRARDPREVAAAQTALPAAAYVRQFGMSDIERPFLVEQTYGKRYLGEGSQMHDDGGGAAPAKGVTRAA